MLALTGVGVAASDVVVDAMMVTAGRETGKTRLFQSAQWASVNLATIFGGVFGSIICARWAQQPSTALRMAGFVAMGVPLVVACLTWYLVDDQRAAINVAEFTATGKALLSAFTSIRLWLVVIFLFLIRFNPGMTTALYSHLQDNIKLSNAQLAVLDTISSAGMVIGALLFMTLMSGRMPTRRAIVIGLVVAALGILPNLLIQGMLSGAAAYLIFGITAQVGGLSQLTVAAEACPKRVEAVVFAALMAIENLSIQYCDVVGSRLYDGPLHQNIQPLILLSAGLTAAGLIFVPMLGGGGDKEKSAGTQSSEDLAATAT
jgi:predicted MFS family arabinose efflux permease